MSFMSQITHVYPFRITLLVFRQTVSWDPLRDRAIVVAPQDDSNLQIRHIYITNPGVFIPPRELSIWTANMAGRRDAPVTKAAVAVNSSESQGSSDVLMKVEKETAGERMLKTYPVHQRAVTLQEQPGSRPSSSFRLSFSYLNLVFGVRIPSTFTVGRREFRPSNSWPSRYFMRW
jgi:hypothetical protein